MLRLVTGKAKFATFQRRVGGPRALAVGLLELLWHFTAANAADGSIGQHSDEEIEAWIGWNGEPGALVEALVASRWVDRVAGAARLYTHDWHDHADRSVHMRLGRERRRFGNGTAPKLGYLPADERRAADEWYAGHPQEPAPEVRRNSAEVVGQGQGQRAGAEEQGQEQRKKRRPPAASAAPAAAPTTEPAAPEPLPPEDPAEGFEAEKLINLLGAENRERALPWLVESLPHLVAAARKDLAAKKMPRPDRDALTAAVKERMFAFWKQHKLGGGTATEARASPLKRFDAPPTVEQIREAYRGQGRA